MTKNTKVVSFEKFQKKREKADYKLKAIISMHIERNIEAYIMEWNSQDKSLSKEKMYLIAKSILFDLSYKVHEIPIEKKATYEKTFTLYYYENANKKNDIKYLCIPQNITNEKLAEYLFIMTNMYEFREAGEV